MLMLFPLFLASLLWLTSLLLMLMLFPLFLASLLLASPNVPVVSCTAFSPSVYEVISAVNVPGVPAVASLLLLTSLLLPMFPPVVASLLLLAFPTVPVDSCAAVGPVVDLFLPLVCRPWSLCYG
jgi:hypothetical protein